MAKLGEVSQETAELVANIASEYGLDNFMNIKPLCIAKQRSIIKVQKANPTTEYVGKCPDTIFLYIVEEILDRMNDRDKELIVRDALNSIEYDNEKDKISVVPPQICVTLGGRAKFGDELLNACEQAVLIARQIEEEKAEAKATAKEEKKSKKKN